MIPGKIFTNFAKFQGPVSVNDIRLPIRAPRTLTSSFVFPEKFFVFAGIRLDPLGGQVLHHDSVSMIVSKALLCLFVLETIRTGAMRVIHVIVKTEETQKFVLYCTT